MVYSSLLFIYGFFPVSLLLFYITPKKHRELTLLLLSALFCCGISAYFLIFIFLFTLINYAMCRLIEMAHKSERLSAVPLSCGIIIDLMSIFVFRTDYFSWLQDIIKVPERFFPIGISFYALSVTGTLIDVYKKRIKAERSFLKFALYIMFFPRLFMGPLLRYETFRKVMDNRREGLSEIGAGMTVFIKGLAKKVIIADNLYMLYSASRSVGVTDMSALTAWLGVIAFLLCLYFELSAFADMGTGIGYCFGCKFPRSFYYPIMSTRIKFFTSRWQPQIIHWIRRYVTKPFTSACPKKWLREIIFVSGWVLCGLWYSISLNGIIFGLLIGIALILEKYLVRNNLMNFTGIFYTQMAVILCTVFFSGRSLSYSFRYLFALIGGNGSFTDAQSFYLLKYYLVLILISVYAATDLFRNMVRRLGKTKAKNLIPAVSPLMMLAALAVCTALISYSGSSDRLLIWL